MPINRRRMPVSLGVCLTLGAAALFAASPKGEEGVKLFESGRYGPARAALEAAAKEEPKDARVALYLGRILMNANDLDNAVAWLERGEECLKLYLQHTPKPDEPSLVSAHYRLGLIYEKKGNRDLARREYAARPVSPGRARRPEENLLDIFNERLLHE